MQHILKPKSEGGLGYLAKDVFMFGRSIGTGPATTFAKLFRKIDANGKKFKIDNENNNSTLE